MKTEDLNEQLIDSCKEGNIEKAERLIEKGAEVNFVNSDNKYAMTPLMWASCRGDIELAEILIDKGANVNAFSRDGQTALRMAAYYFKTKMAKLLIKNGADVNSVDEVGQTCLIDACDTFESMSEMSRLLTDAGAEA